MTVSRYKTTSQVAAKYQISVRLVLDHIHSGVMPATDVSRRGSRKPRFRLSEDDLAVFESRRAVRAAVTPKQRRKKNPNVIEFFLFLIGITATLAKANDPRFRNEIAMNDEQARRLLIEGIGYVELNHIARQNGKDRTEMQDKILEILHKLQADDKPRGELFDRDMELKGGDQYGPH